MARGVNKVILIGILGQDPQISTTTSGLLVANLSIAVSESRKDSNGNLQQKTEWVRCVLFNNLAKIAQDWLRKGSQIYVEGKLQTRQYEDKTGVQRSVTEVVVNELTMLGGNQGKTGYPNDEFNGSISNYQSSMMQPGARQLEGNNQHYSYEGTMGQPKPMRSDGIRNTNGEFVQVNTSNDTNYSQYNKNIQAGNRQNANLGNMGNGASYSKNVMQQQENSLVNSGNATVSHMGHNNTISSNMSSNSIPNNNFGHMGNGSSYNAPEVSNNVPPPMNSQLNNNIGPQMNGFSKNMNTNVDSSDIDDEDDIPF